MVDASLRGWHLVVMWLGPALAGEVGRVKLLAICGLLSVLCSSAVQGERQQTLSEKIRKHPAAPVLAAGQTPGEMVEYQSDERRLKAILYVPPGRGPFPVMMFLHGADKNPNPQPELAQFYLSHGIAFFLPYRMGHAGNPGQTIKEKMQPSPVEDTNNPANDERFAAYLKSDLHDVAAAVSWLKSDARFDSSRVYLSGISYGSIETFLAADEISGIRACVVFSGGARIWSHVLIQKMLASAVRDAQTPILLIEAANDYSLGPVQGLYPILKTKRPPNGCRMYPAFGDPTDVTMGHIAFSTWDLGTEIWGANVLGFLQAATHSIATTQVVSDGVR